MSDTSSKNPSSPVTQKRKHMRFAPDPNMLVWATPLGDAGEPAGDPIVGLAIEESFQGCSAVMRSMSLLRRGQKFLVAVGNLAPLPGEIVWTRDLEPGVMRVGFSLKG
jgi:hypothetical protein